MRRLVLILTLLTATLAAAPSLAQTRLQLRPLCTTDTTPADQQIDACNKIIAMKVFSGEKLATIYFWRAVAWNKKGDYTQVIADASEAIRLKGDVAIYNLRGSAYYDKGGYDIAISDFNDAIRLGPPGGIVFHNRGNAFRARGDFERAIADTTEAIRLAKARAPVNVMTPPGSVLISAYTQRGFAHEAKGDYERAKQDYNPPNDAHAIAKSLRDIGFGVSEGIELDRATMAKTIRDFLREAARAQVAVVYYAGHGVQIDGRKFRRAAA
jgi:Tfp pilus assembly protein PilF